MNDESPLGLLIELDEAGATSLWTDRDYIYIYPKGRMSLRLRGELMRMKCKLVKILRRYPLEQAERGMTEDV